MMDLKEIVEGVLLEMQTLGMDMDAENKCQVYTTAYGIIEEALIDAYFDGTITVCKDGV